MAKISSDLKRAEITIRRRVECEEKAFHIVNKLIDGFVKDQYLSECGNFISKENYDDIVEERAISKLCGYPICCENLQNVPKQQYHISTKTNKVYDISERKSFCSNQCFKASKSFRQQIPESPVWAREDEVIHIHVSSSKAEAGLVGDEVIGINPLQNLKQEVEHLDEMEKKKENKNLRDEEKTVGTQMHDIVESPDDRKAEQINLSLPNPPLLSYDNSPLLSDKDNMFFEETCHGLDSLCVEDSGPQFTLNKSVGTDTLDSVISDQIPCKSSALDNCNLNSIKTDGVILKKDLNSEPVSKLDQLQTLLNRRKNFLSGMIDSQEVIKVCPKERQQQCDSAMRIETTKERENDVCDNVSHKEQKTKRVTVKSPKSNASLLRSQQAPLKVISQILQTWVSVNTVKYLQFKKPYAQSKEPHFLKFSDLQVQVDYTNLCKSLDSQEKELNNILEEMSDSVNDEDAHKELKTIPDYNVLKEEADKFQLKVTEFITGKKQNKSASRVKNEDTEKDEVYIPTVDAYDQARIRAKIVLERVDRCLPDLLIPMGLSVQDVSSFIRELVHTFRLERDTIIFKPAEWTLVSIFILKMLSFRAKFVEECFNKDSTVQFFNTLLKGIHLTLDDIEFSTKEILLDAAVDFDK